MLTQKEFVEGCYNWYRETDLQPGNPEDGQWDEAHYPVPKCKGGTETILLLREHHAVQGVIQSVEMQWRCIWGWEKKYLSGEYLELYYKCESEGWKLYFASQTEEEKKLWTGKLKASAVARHARMTEEEKILRAEKISASAVAYLDRLTEEERILRAEKLRAAHAQMPEEKKILKAEKLRAKAVDYHAQLTEEEKILRAEKLSEGANRGWARRKFNKEVEDLVAVWEMGLRP